MSYFCNFIAFGNCKNSKLKNWELKLPVLHNVSAGYVTVCSTCQTVFKTIKALFSALVLSLVIGWALDMILPFPKSVAKLAKQLKICSRKLQQYQWSKGIKPMLSNQCTQSGLLTMATKLRRIWWRINWGSSLEQMAVMIVSMLMQRLEKSTIECIVPMQAIAVFALVLWESAKSMTFSDVASTSLKSSCLTRTLFLWGRKADGSTESALILRLVTFLVAKFHWSIWEARIFDMTQIDIWVDRILVKSCCLANSCVIPMRSANWLARAAWGWFRTTCIPFNGVARMIFNTHVALMSMLPRMWSNIAFFGLRFFIGLGQKMKHNIARSIGSEGWSNRLWTKL